MAKKYKTRKEFVKGPDEFLTFSARSLEFARSHIQELKYAGIALGIVLAGFVAIQAYLRHENGKGQAAYNAGYYALTENLKPESKPAEWKKAGDSFQKVIDDYGLSKASRLSLPQVGFVDFLNGNYDKASASYGKFLEKISQDSPYRPLVKLALASCYEAKGDMKMAIGTLSPMEKRRGPFGEPILLSLARYYREDGQPEKAKGVLKDFAETHGDSPFLPMVKARLQESF